MAEINLKIEQNIITTHVFRDVLKLLEKMSNIADRDQTAPWEQSDWVYNVC